MGNNIKRVDHANVQKKAKRLLRKAGIKNPPIDIKEIAKNLGLNLIDKPLDDGVSGFLFTDKKSTPIIGVNSDHSPERQRFTLAHELGHLFLHAQNTTTEQFVDKNFFIANRDSKSSKGIDYNEIEANLFASEVLMPSEMLYKEFVKLVSSSKVDEEVEKDVIQKLSENFNVSKEAMKLRLNNLGFIHLSYGK